jgi:hypothetical protein
MYPLKVLSCVPTKMRAREHTDISEHGIMNPGVPAEWVVVMWRWSGTV